MSTISLKRLTGFFHSAENPHPETWVNPSHVCYVTPRLVTRGHAEVADGTRLFFSQDGGVLDVREPIGEVIALLQSGPRGLCRDCYEVLPEAWMQLCTPCRAHHNGVHIDPEEAAVS